MIGLAGSEMSDAAREALSGLLDAHHDLSRVRRLREDASGFDAAAWKRLGDEGWLAARVPEEAGGTGLTAQAAAAVPDLFGARLVTEPYVALALLPALVLAAARAGAARDATLASIIAGERRIALAWQEREGQFGPAREQATRLVVQGGRPTLNGRKLFVAGGAAADGLLVTATDEMGAGVVLAVDVSAPGVTIEPVKQIDGSRSATVRFDAVAIESAAVVSHDTAGVCAALDEARIALAVQMLAMAREALRITIDYAGTRRQFGRTIGSFQALQHRMVDYATRIRLAEVTCDAALQALDAAQREPGDIARHAVAAKASAAETAVLVSQGAIQIHGAIGYTDEADIGLYLAATLTLAPWLGTVAGARARFLDLGGATGHA